MLPTPKWWKYAVIEDEDGVGIVKGFKKDTPIEVIEEYKEYVKAEKKRAKDEDSTYY